MSCVDGSSWGPSVSRTKRWSRTDAAVLATAVGQHRPYVSFRIASNLNGTKLWSSSYWAFSPRLALPSVSLIAPLVKRGGKPQPCFRGVYLKRIQGFRNPGERFVPRLSDRPQARPSLATVRNWSNKAGKPLHLLAGGQTWTSKSPRQVTHFRPHVNSDARCVEQPGWQSAVKQRRLRHHDRARQLRSGLPAGQRAVDAIFQDRCVSKGEAALQWMTCGA